MGFALLFAGVGVGAPSDGEKGKADTEAKTKGKDAPEEGNVSPEKDKNGIDAIHVPREGDWKKQKQVLKEKIQEFTRKKARETVTRRQIAERLGFSWPVKAPARQRKEIREEIKKKVQKRTQKEFPMSRVQTFKKEAKKKYPLAEKGEEVSITLRGGRGRGAKLQDEVFMGKTRNRVNIGGSWVFRGDMDKETESLFYPEVNKKMRRDYVRTKRAQLITNRDTFQKQLKRELAKKLFRKANYIYDRRQGVWRAKKKILEKAVGHFRQKKYEELQPEIEAQVFRNHNYAFKEGTWQPKSILGRITGKMRDITSSKKGKSKQKEETGGEKGEEVPPEGTGKPSPKPPEGAPSGLFDESQ